MELWRRIRSWIQGNRIDVSERFELLREAVHGTMSQFYMARDRKLDRTVGLKLLDPEKTATFERRFAGLDKPSEGEIAITLSHPAIVDTLEYGETTTGETYLVMEYLEGQGMNTLIQIKEELFDRRRLELLSQAAAAVAAVHEAGFIHRDICPRNFMISQNRETLKLIDFGLSIPDEPDFCQPGNRTGTPRYMSPEIVRRRVTDHRVDIFSFGVTAYEMFARQLPWPSSVVTGRAAMEHDKPAIPLSEYCPHIKESFAVMIHRCLEPDPERRPAKMAEVLNFMQKLDGEAEA
jgi:serine/threonine-protein kinase